MVQLIAVQPAHLCRSNSYPLRPHRVTWIKTNRIGVKSGRSSVTKPTSLAWAAKLTNVVRVGLETHSVFNAGSIRHGRPPPQVHKKLNAFTFSKITSLCLVFSGLHMPSLCCWPRRVACCFTDPRHWLRRSGQVQHCWFYTHYDRSHQWCKLKTKWVLLVEQRLLCSLGFI